MRWFITSQSKRIALEKKVFDCGWIPKQIQTLMIFDLFNALMFLCFWSSNTKSLWSVIELKFSSLKVVIALNLSIMIFRFALTLTISLIKLFCTCVAWESVFLTYDFIFTIFRLTARNDCGDLNFDCKHNAFILLLWEKKFRPFIQISSTCRLKSLLRSQEYLWSIQDRFRVGKIGF